MNTKYVVYNETLLSYTVLKEYKNWYCLVDNSTKEVIKTSKHCELFNSPKEAWTAYLMFQIREKCGKQQTKIAMNNEIYHINESIKLAKREIKNLNKSLKIKNK